MTEHNLTHEQLTCLRLTYLRSKTISAAADLKEGRADRAHTTLLEALDTAAPEKTGAAMQESISSMDRYLDDLSDLSHMEFHAG